MVQCLIDYRMAYRKERIRQRVITQARKSSRRKRCKSCPECYLSRSGWEGIVCKRLTDNGIAHRHQSRRYPLVFQNKKQLTYTPDIEAGGVIVEPHFNIDGPFINKMEAEELEKFDEYYNRRKNRSARTTR